MTRARVFIVFTVLIGWSPAPPDDLASRVTIYRDTYGIPHVFGETDAATMFGFAYAQAEDNFWRIEDNYIRALGRRAEVEGERGLTNDWRNRALEIPRLAREEYRRLPPKMIALLDGFTRGLNAYLADHPDVRPRLLTRFEPWYPLAFIRYNYYQSGFFWGAGFRSSDFAAATSDTARLKDLGSNGWVIGPGKSATGHAMLFINPHLPFFGFGQVYEGHVKSGEGWNFTGYTRFGFPFPYVGHNESLGWVSTDNAADQADLYVETFDDSTRPLRYRYGSGYRDAIAWTDLGLSPVALDLGVFHRESRAVSFREAYSPISGLCSGRTRSLSSTRWKRSESARIFG